MTTGLNESLMVMSENVMLDTAIAGELWNVLIRAPFEVPMNVTLEISTFLTSFSSGYLPILPILQHHIGQEFRKEEKRKKCVHCDEH